MSVRRKTTQKTRLGKGINLMTFFIKYASFFKWTSLAIGIIGFILRIIQGELEEDHVVRNITSETRMDGSLLGYLLTAIIILALLSFVIFNQLSKKKNR